MKPTKPSILILSFVPAALAAFFVSSLLVERGFPAPLSPLNLTITLAAIAVVLLLLAIPIWRYRSALKQTPAIRVKRVDPFYAVRVLLLAKASALAGVIFAGAHLGVVLFALSGSVVVQSLVLQNAFGFIASILLSAAGLITEQICRLPEDSTTDPDQAVTS